MQGYLWTDWPLSPSPVPSCVIPCLMVYAFRNPELPLFSSGYQAFSHLCVLCILLLTLEIYFLHFLHMPHSILFIPCLPCAAFTDTSDNASYDVGDSRVLLHCHNTLCIQLLLYIKHCSMRFLLSFNWLTLCIYLLIW